MNRRIKSIVLVLALLVFLLIGVYFFAATKRAEGMEELARNLAQVMLDLHDDESTLVDTIYLKASELLDSVYIPERLGDESQ